VDFLTCPTSYEFRWSGRGYSHFSSPIASLQHHGKLWLDENDLQTWLAKPNAFPGAYGRPASYEETLQQQQREFVTVICQGTGMWWFDMGEGGWYDDERLMRDLAQMKRIAAESLTWERSAVSEVALIVDDHSLAYLQVSNELSPALLLAQLPELGRMGAPYSVYALDDLPAVPPHKVYLFVNCFKPEAEHLAAIEALKRDGRVLVWFYAPGYLQENGTDLAAMQRLTGIRIACDTAPAPLRVALSGQDALLSGASAGASYGTDIAIGPVFSVDDPGAQVLGRYADGRAGLAVRRGDGWTSIYSAAPTMPSWLLRNIAREASVHLYLESDDTLYANRSLLGLCVNEGGERLLRLPARCDVYDLFEERWLARGVRELRLEMGPWSTKLLRLLPG